MEVRRGAKDLTVKKNQWVTKYYTTSLSLKKTILKEISEGE
jgi:hypothetical protein